MQTQIFNDTYEKQIAAMLKADETVTVLSVLKKVGTIEARHFIARLKKQGMDIKSQWKVGNDGKRFKSYSLNKNN